MPMIKKRLPIVLLLGIFLLCIAGCGSDDSNGKSYLDEEGNYYFGEWAFEMNGPEGNAALYDLSDEELEEWLDENGYIEAGITVESARRDTIYAVMSVVKLTDEEIKATYGARDEEITRYRDYVADKFGDPADYNLEDYAPNTE